MTTVINTPGSNGDTAGSNSAVTGVLLLLVVILVVVFGFYGLSRIQGRGGTNNSDSNPAESIQNNVQNEPAAPQGDSTNIQVPEKIDVNVQGLPSGQPSGQ